MNANSDRLQTPDYTILDRPEVLSALFHPRKEPVLRKTPDSAQEVAIEVAAGVFIGGCFHMTAPEAPNILFFHGNGEIVADYDDLGTFYNRLGINFMPVDYRGYGRSDGSPTVAAMMQDSPRIMEFIIHWLDEKGYTGPLVLMGRSLGSTSALELAATCNDAIAGLIIESGFAYTAPLMQILGIDPKRIGFDENKGFANLDKIGRWQRPLLIIHAEFDHIIPFSDGQALYDHCPSQNKRLLKIPGANHNDIFARGLEAYMSAVKTFLQEISNNANR